MCQSPVRARRAIEVEMATSIKGMTISLPRLSYSTCRELQKMKETQPYLHPPQTARLAPTMHYLAGDKSGTSTAMSQKARSSVPHGPRP